ncbi:MAG: phosphoglycerate kinase [Candidatus Heimdallarchaeaceae archaeon]
MLITAQKSLEVQPRDMTNILKFKEKMEITDINVRNKRVLVRVDFNVPMDEDGNITDDRRIRYTLPTIYYLLNENCKIILMSHWGRPKGKIVPSLKMDAIARRLRELLPLYRIYKADSCIGKEVKELSNKLNQQQILLLENTRFYPEEVKNDEEFSRNLALHADVFINDAFATSHREHASTCGVANYVEEKGYGFLMAKELKFLSSTIAEPHRPLTAIIGGVKLEDKLPAIKNLIGLADNILIGGGLAYTFLLALGYDVGKSVKDLNKVETVKQYLEEAKEVGTKIYIPSDVIVTEDLRRIVPVDTVPITNIQKNQIGADIGPQTIQEYKEVLMTTKEVLWTGPLGIFETKEFEKGTRELAQFLVEQNITTFVGGGDSAAAFEKFDFEKDISFVSTGGGASLAVMKGELLPAIDFL